MVGRDHSEIRRHLLEPHERTTAAFLTEPPDTHRASGTHTHTPDESLTTEHTNGSIHTHTHTWNDTHYKAVAYMGKLEHTS